MTESNNDAKTNQLTPNRLDEHVVPSFSWDCIHFPNNDPAPMNGLWGYGQIVDAPATPYGKRMENIQARIERQKDGRWFYIVFGHPTQQGAEPSRGEAMKACEYWIRHNAVMRRPATDETKTREASTWSPR